MTEEITPEEREAPDHKKLSDDQLIDRLRDHRKGTNEWAAALGELQRRGDRVHSNERFRALLASAEDNPEPPPETGDDIGRATN
jgi:hypothetical protein